MDLVRHCSRELRENDAGQMAAALTYRTIFGLVPLLMVSMLAFRLFGDMEAAARQLQSAAYAFFNYQVDPTRPEATAFKEVLDERLLDIMKAVGGLSFEAIGAVGALLLIWAALGLLISFEDAANRIYRAPRGRRLAHPRRHLLDGAHARARSCSSSCSTPPSTGWAGRRRCRSWGRSSPSSASSARSPAASSRSPSSTSCCRTPSCAGGRRSRALSWRPRSGTPRSGPSASTSAARCPT